MFDHFGEEKNFLTRRESNPWLPICVRAPESILEVVLFLSSGDWMSLSGQIFTFLCQDGLCCGDHLLTIATSFCHILLSE
jgi:hypothetical protein